MRFTPSATYLMLAKAAAKELSWAVWTRPVTDLDGAMAGYVGWTDASRFVELESLPTFPAEIEKETGEFTMDSARIKGLNIAWWKANVFNATHYIECKVECTLVGASDAPIVFAGFIDKKPQYSELTDSVSFVIESVEAIGGRLSSENLVTQYIDPDYDTFAHSGLFMPQLPAIYVTDANVSGRVLKFGRHEISYEWNGGAPRAKLDDGGWVTLATASNNSYTLTNNAGDQALEITSMALTKMLFQGSAPLKDVVIVTVYGDTLPKQPHYGLSLSNFVKKVYALLGITTVTTDVLEISSYDGNKRIGYLEYPPDNPAVTGKRYALASDGTNLYIGIGGVLYKRTAAGVYSLLATVSASRKIERLYYNARNDEVWALLNASQYPNRSASYARRINATSGSMGTETSLAGNVGVNNCTLIDYNYTGSSYKYGLIFGRQGNPAVIGYIDGADSVSTVYTMPSGYLFSSGITSGAYDFSYYRSGGETFFLMYVTPTVDGWYYKFGIDGAGAFTAPTAVGAGAFPAYHLAAYNATDDRVYFLDSAANAGSAALRSHPYNSSTITSLVASMVTQWNAEGFGGAGTSSFCTISDATGLRHFYELSANAATERAYPASDWLTPPAGFTSHAGVLHGLDEFGLLWKYDSAIAMFGMNYDFPGESVTGALNNMLRSWNLVATTTPAKAAYVYRRGNQSGVPQNSGNTFAITVREASDLSEDVNSYPASGFVSISNGQTSATYDGTNYDGGVLVDVRTVSITSPHLANNILRDVAKYVYNFFSTARTLYRVQCNHYPMFNYEPFDEASLTFAVTKIQRTASGVIYNAAYSPDGSVAVEVLI